MNRARLTAALLLMLPFAPAIAGGLVESDLDTFLEATFDGTSADITNPWWTLPGGSNFLYFAEEDDECAWNLVEVLALTTDAFGGDYAGTSEPDSELLKREPMRFAKGSR
jgi:hypothetical protein